MKKENKIRKDFHGNRDFYNLIKGIAIELKSGDYSEKEKVEIIIKNIERNFGGIEYEIDIDLELIFEDTTKEFQLIRDIIKEYYLFFGENRKIKLDSIFLFKKLYNLECEKKDPNSNLKISKFKINDYNLNNCINDNIKDVNSRYLLLETEPSLSMLIYQHIKLCNPFKNTLIYNGSPFVDDNNKEYRFRILKQIKENVREDCLIILENLNQIHPFLYDLYNRNYLIKDGKKYAKIFSEEYFYEQLTEANNKLRIIVLADKNFIEKADSAFLNRLEKMTISFDKVLDNDLKELANNLIDEINLKKTIKKYEEDINYSLKDLLINCGKEKIQGLVYYFSNKLKENYSDEKYRKNLKENIKENVYNKIYKILPQDIIFILQDNNEIKKRYLERKDIFNFKNYIYKEEYEKYKISIIYTFTSLSKIVEGLDNEMSFMISEIKSEDSLKNLIDEIKIRNENNNLKKNYNKICIHFDISNSSKIEFVSNFILKNFQEDKYNYIFIMHINRNFNKRKRQRFYSLPDIYDDINQVFIDNLNGNNSIKIKYLLGSSIKEIIKRMNLDEELI